MNRRARNEAEPERSQEPPRRGEFGLRKEGR
jgi:hypothetical protein